MQAPYKSKYYEKTQFYERYGNIFIRTGLEIYFYIIDRTIPGIEPYRYSISNKLNVFDYKLNNFVRISNLTAYPSINLYNSKKRKTITSSLHRVYMMTFCYFPGCENYEVNHIDGNKYNCHPSNLEWTTHAENMDHATKYILSRKLSDEDIIEIIDMYNDNNTIKNIAEKFNISTGYVCDIVRGTLSTMPNIKSIIEKHPVTRNKFEPKLNTDLLKIIADRYNNGEEYFELAEEYKLDRSYLTKQIKLYAKSHPEIVIRPLKKFTKETVEDICEIFQNNSNLDSMSLYKLCIESLGLEDNSSVRKALSNIHVGKTYKKISSKYNFK